MRPDARQAPSPEMDAPRAERYVYYRVHSADQLKVVAAVQIAHAQWRQRAPGCGVRLLQRDDPSGPGQPADDITFMEVFVGLSVTLEADWWAWNTALAGTLGAWLIGERHVEVFVPCA